MVAFVVSASAPTAAHSAVVPSVIVNAGHAGAPPVPLEALAEALEVLADVELVVELLVDPLVDDVDVEEDDAVDVVDPEPPEPSSSLRQAPVNSTKVATRA